MAQDNSRLETLRSQADAIDTELLLLLERRASLAKEVSTLRKAAALATASSPGEDASGSLVSRAGPETAAREGQVSWSPRAERAFLEQIDRRGAGAFPRRTLRSIFREIYAAAASIEAPMRVSYEGPLGSTAHEAARRRFGAAAEYLACEGARGALDLVARGHAETAIVCLESSREGLLQPTLDALADSELKIVDAPEHHVRIHLLNRTGNLGDIEKVYAAPSELASCARFLANNLPRAAILDTRNPTMAAQFAAQDHGAAALGGDVLGELHQLLVARANVSDESGEQFRCAVLAARPSQSTGHDVTAFVISIDDSPGALFRILQPLADRGLNLRRIQSRPRAHSAEPEVVDELLRDSRNAQPAPQRYEGERQGRKDPVGEPNKPRESHSAKLFRFFLEVEGHVTDRPLVTAFEEMKRGVRDLKILGSYPSAS